MFWRASAVLLAQSCICLSFRAYARIGNAYAKKGEMKEALNWLGKSLSEHRDNEIVKKHKQLEKEIAESERLAYIDPAKADEEKALGNAAFKSGDWPLAIKHYSEALKVDIEQTAKSL